MARYVCPYCNRLVFYNDDHPCYTYMLEDINTALPQMGELEETDKRLDVAEDTLMNNSEEITWKLFSDGQQQVSEKSKLVTGSNYEEEKTGTQISDFFPANANNECGSILKENKRMSFSKDKGNFMTSLEISTTNALSENKNISETLNFLDNSHLSLFNMGSNNDMTGALHDQKDIIISSGVASEAQNNIEENNLKENKPVCSIKADSAIIGPFRRLSFNKNYDCELYDKQFESKSHFKEHYHSSSYEKPLELDKCGKQFAEKSNKKRCYRTHTDENLFECHIRGNSFAQVENLNRHYDTQTGDKLFSCVVCGKKFNQKSNLKTHSLIHSGEKRFECTICAKRFTRKEHLDEHYRIHTGEKAFKCRVCGKAFISKRSCNRHQRNTHK